MIRFRAAGALSVCLLFSGIAVANECPRPDALGMARTITVEPANFVRVGTMQYRQTVPLAPKEVVLTFDDGPMPPMTGRVLDILQSECVKATFFLIGRNARAFPSFVQRIAKDGHTVATHSQNHPLNFDRLAYARGVREIDDGFRAADAALEPIGMKTAPFFRFPALKSTRAFEQYLQSHGISAMSADFLADDWYRRLTPDQVLSRALSRLEAKGSGILLLHDVKPGTALMLPRLLKELKERGYRIVHMAPPAGTASMVAMASAPSAPAAKDTAAVAKPRAAKRRLASNEPRNGRGGTQKPPETANGQPSAKFWPRILDNESRSIP